MPTLIELRDRVHAPTHARCRRSRSYTDLLSNQKVQRLSSQWPTSSGAAIAFLNELRNVLQDDSDLAVDYVYREIDALLRREDFSRVDDILKAMDVQSLPVLPLLAFVSITNAPRSSLSARTSFVGRVRRHLEQIEPNRVGELLVGIE